MQVAGLRCAGESDGDAVGAVHQQGDEAAALIQQGIAPLSHEAVVQHARGAVEAAVGGGDPAALTVDGAVGGQHDDVFHQRAQIGGVCLIAALGGDGQHPGEEPRGLSPGDSGGVGDDVQPFVQPQFRGGADGTVGPGAGGLGGIAQNAQDEGDSLLIGDVAVGLEFAVAHAGHEPGLSGFIHHQRGSQIHVSPAPVGAGYVGEDSAVHLGLGLIALAHNLDGHLAESHAGQRVVGHEVAVFVAVDHAQRSQRVRRLRLLGVGDIGEVAGLHRCGGQGEHSGRRQHQCENSFEFRHLQLISSLILPAGLPPAGGRRP